MRFDTVRSGCFIVYIEGTHFIISKKYYISFPEDGAVFHLGLHSVCQRASELKRIAKLKCVY